MRDPISKNPSQQRAGKVAQGVGPKFKPQYHKKNKNKTEVARVPGHWWLTPVILFGRLKLEDCGLRPARANSS
jgi:hypothetical protein